MKSASKNCDLHSCFFCRGCLPEWQPAILAHRRQIRFGKGDAVFREGDPVEGIFFIESGWVKVHQHWGTDKELILRFASDGDVIGHRGLGGENIYPVSATTLHPVRACYIPLDFFMTSLKVNRDFSLQLLLFYASELQESEKRMRNLAHMPVKGRLAQSLLRLHKKFGTDATGALRVPLSQQDLASYTGTAYESVFRILQEFIAEGWIRKEGKKIILLQPEALQQLAQLPPGK